MRRKQYKKGSNTISMRVDVELFEQLNKEANDKYRTLTNYITYLVKTQPERKINKQ